MNDKLVDHRDRVLVGDTFELLDTLPEASIDTVWSSPPYYSVRAYPVEVDITRFGEEATVDEYVERTVQLFFKMERVLKPWGTVWWNLGDSYSAGMGQGVASKNACMIPFRVAMALQSHGWYVRNIIAWVKKSTMPEPHTDRLSTAWEPVILLAHPHSDGQYHFDMDRIRLPSKDKVHPAGVPPKDWCQVQRANFKGKEHFAMQPLGLPGRYLPATLPAKVCPKCSRPTIYTAWRSEGQTWGDYHEERDRTWRPEGRSAGNTGLKNRHMDDRKWEKETIRCGCEAGTMPGVVLDPFMGSGTTAVAAKRVGCDFVGFEAIQEVADRAVERVRCEPMDLFTMMS